tara:strand:+ start:181 stop:921 length:741 start_codon:yes stop_codon:yes gene_type:complete
MIDKKGQVTIFIIIAILIVAFVVIFFMFRESREIKEPFLIPESQLYAIKNSIDGCLEITAIDGIRLTGMQGGYIFPPENSLETNLSTIAYGYYKGKNTLIPLDKMQNEIVSYVKLAMPLCFDEGMFEDLSITSNDLNAEVKINSNSVSLLIDYPISITKESATLILEEEYRTEIPIRLGKIHKKANELIEKEKENPLYIELTYLTNSDYDISILPYKKNVLIYSITDENSQIDDVPYTFIFANRLR